MVKIIYILKWREYNYLLDLRTVAEPSHSISWDSERVHRMPHSSIYINTSHQSFLFPLTHCNSLSLITYATFSLLTVNLNATVSNRIAWQTLRETETVPPLSITGNQIDYKAALRRHFKLTVTSIGTSRFHFFRR
jgi:hypothetical protein